MIGQSPALKDRNLEHSTTISLQREPTCFAFMCSTAICPPLPIDAINLDLASADYFGGRASIWTTLEMRSAAADNRPTAVLGFDEAFLRPFTRALIEAAATRAVYRMRIVDPLDDSNRYRVVEYVTGPGTPLRAAPRSARTARRRRCSSCPARTRSCAASPRSATKPIRCCATRWPTWSAWRASVAPPPSETRATACPAPPPARDRPHRPPAAASRPRSAAPVRPYAAP